MKETQPSYLTCALALLTLALFASASEPVGSAFSYRGNLTANGGQANGRYDLKFTLFDSFTNGTPVAAPITNVAVSINFGLFNAALDFGPSAFNGDKRWLEIAVRTNDSSADFETLAPRQELAPQPNALYAQSAGTATIALSLAPGNLAGPFSLTNAANVFTGDGSGITGLDASNLSLGTVPDSRLSSNVGLLNASQVFSGANYFAGVNALTNAANTFAGVFVGNGSGLLNLNPANISSGTAGINISGNAATATSAATAATAVSAATAATAGSFSGSLSGDVTGTQGATVLARIRGVPMSTTAPSPNQLLRYDGDQWVPATASLQTDVSGTLPDSRLSANVPFLSSNQVFSGANTLSNAANQFVGRFTGDGSGLSNLVVGVLGPIPASQLIGILPSDRLAGTYSGVLHFSNPSNSFAGDGTGLSGVNAAALGGLTSTSFWQTSGNSGTTTGVNFLGTTDNQPLELKVNGQRAFRLEPTTGEPNIIGGASANQVSPGVAGAVISGGSQNTIYSNYANIGGGFGNIVTGYVGTISGGYSNFIAGPGAVIGGGGYDGTNISGNFNAGAASTIAGGIGNIIPAIFHGFDADCTIGGGRSNAMLLAQDYVPMVGCTISGGSQNAILGGHMDWPSSDFAAIGGGEQNFISGGSDHSWIGGGKGNSFGLYASNGSIGGGYSNSITSWLGFSRDADNCAIGGGALNEISCYFEGESRSSIIGGGEQNDTRGSWATIGGGFRNSITGQYAAIGGGGNNVVITSGLVDSGPRGFGGGTVGGGLSNVVSGDFGTIPGGLAANSSNYGQMAYASGQFATNGDAQTSVYVCRGTTTSGTQSEIFLDGDSQRISMPTNSTWALDILISGRASNGDSAAYQLLGAAKTTGGSAVLVAGAKKTVIATDQAAWDASLGAAGTNNTLILKVTGAAATSIRWVATVRTTEVGY